jgi:hypothetical protein
MADTQDKDLEQAQPRASACRHLRSNRMYVFSDGGDHTDADDDDSSSYWCLQTMKPIGPDDDRVDGHQCRNAARSCYQPL